MGSEIKKVDFFYTVVKDKPGMAYQVLDSLEQMGINQLAFAAVPVGLETTQLTIFPEDPAKFVHEAKLASMKLDGPYHAFLVQGDDELGALVGYHQKLFDANINVYASSGVTNAAGGFGYLIYVKEDDFQRAADALGL